MHDVAIEAFRSRLHTWLACEAPANGWDQPSAVDESEHDRLARARACQKLIAEGGFAGITWPVEHGGQGLGVAEQIVFDQETAHYNLPLTPLVITLGICGPALLAMGTEAQKLRHLRPLLTGEEMWCQLYSEPGAGSDIAGLSTRATRLDGGWAIDGQKVWTSGAANCAFGLLLARSNADVPKHRGLTMFIVDMALPGIDVRPLRQMNGSSRFNEVFFDGVILADDAVVGEVDQGWRAATAMLMTERVSIGSGSAGRDAHEVAALIAAARRNDAIGRPSLRAALAAAYERERIADLLGERVAGQVLAGRKPGPEGSLIKLVGTRRSQLAAQLGVDLHGVAGVAWDPQGSADARWSNVMLAAPGLSIAGGTTEVQKNIIGERVLGLPREPQATQPALPVQTSQSTSTGESR
jgi:alkylation response protein AidB-like acyl-CoA dehydrogenase